MHSSIQQPDKSTIPSVTTQFLFYYYLLLFDGAAKNRFVKLLPLNIFEQKQKN